MHIHGWMGACLDSQPGELLGKIFCLDICQSILEWERVSLPVLPCLWSGMGAYYTGHYKFLLARVVE